MYLSGSADRDCAGDGVGTGAVVGVGVGSGEATGIGVGSGDTVGDGDGVRDMVGVGVAVATDESAVAEAVGVDVGAVEESPGGRPQPTKTSAESATTARYFTMRPKRRL